MNNKIFIFCSVMSFSNDGGGGADGDEDIPNPYADLNTIKKKTYIVIRAKDEY